MGKGDKKSKKGKIALGSFGKSRPRKPSSAVTAGAATAAPAAKKKAAVKK